ncbi:hypothetical protein BZG36_02893 [Bifiguratus adelaidae]|uniref:Uncharacterized protein n=1 Tax=Bifiguratus adelaidae TaxID=1938954 RepID=A0A261Y232_9FUNG|nr:hypothetical protein BZG36_02893 [Bifiguratus adelaidae]
MSMDEDDGNDADSEFVAIPRMMVPDPIIPSKPIVLNRRRDMPDYTKDVDGLYYKYIDLFALFINEFLPPSQRHRIPPTGAARINPLVATWALIYLEDLIPYFHQLQKEREWFPYDLPQRLLIASLSIASKYLSSTSAVIAPNEIEPKEPMYHAATSPDLWDPPTPLLAGKRLFAIAGTYNYSPKELLANERWFLALIHHRAHVTDERLQQFVQRHKLSLRPAWSGEMRHVQYNPLKKPNMMRFEPRCRKHQIAEYYQRQGLRTLVYPTRMNNCQLSYAEARMAYKEAILKVQTDCKRLKMSQDNHRPIRRNWSQVHDIVKEHVILHGNVNQAAEEIMRGINPYTQHLKRYLNMYLPNAGYEISSTTRYNEKPEACIIAIKDWPMGDEIRLCQGAITQLTKEEDQMLRDRGTDFSVIWSYRKKAHCIFLGPARFVNHDCDPNCKFISYGKDAIAFKTLRPIKCGEEITADYGSNYFGPSNRECGCLTCERRGSGRYKTYHSSELATQSTGPSHIFDDNIESAASTPASNASNSLDGPGEDKDRLRRSHRSRRPVIFNDFVQHPKRQRREAPSREGSSFDDSTSWTEASNRPSPEPEVSPADIPESVEPATPPQQQPVPIEGAVVALEHDDIMANTVPPTSNANRRSSRDFEHASDLLLEGATFPLVTLPPADDENDLLYLFASPVLGPMGRQVPSGYRVTFSSPTLNGHMVAPRDPQYAPSSKSMAQVAVRDIPELHLESATKAGSTLSTSVTPVNHTQHSQPPTQLRPRVPLRIQNSQPTTQSSTPVVTLAPRPVHPQQASSMPILEKSGKCVGKAANKPPANLAKVPRKVACFHCKAKKQGCDGQYPTCSRCRNRGVACKYPEGKLNASQQFASAPMSRSVSTSVINDSSSRPYELQGAGARRVSMEQHVIASHEGMNLLFAAIEQINTLPNQVPPTSVPLQRVQSSHPSLTSRTEDEAGKQKSEGTLPAPESPQKFAVATEQPEIYATHLTTQEPFYRAAPPGDTISKVEHDSSRTDNDIAVDNRLTGDESEMTDLQVGSDSKEHAPAPTSTKEIHMQPQQSDAKESNVTPITHVDASQSALETKDDHKATKQSVDMPEAPPPKERDSLGNAEPLETQDHEVSVRNEAGDLEHEASPDKTSITQVSDGKSIDQEVSQNDAMPAHELNERDDGDHVKHEDLLEELFDISDLSDISDLEEDGTVLGSGQPSSKAARRGKDLSRRKEKHKHGHSADHGKVRCCKSCSEPISDKQLPIPPELSTWSWTPSSAFPNWNPTRCPRCERHFNLYKCEWPERPKRQLYGYEVAAREERKHRAAAEATQEAAAAATNSSASLEARNKKRKGSTASIASNDGQAKSSPTTANFPSNGQLTGKEAMNARRRPRKTVSSDRFINDESTSPSNTLQEDPLKKRRVSVDARADGARASMPNHSQPPHIYSPTQYIQPSPYPGGWSEVYPSGPTSIPSDIIHQPRTKIVNDLPQWHHFYRPQDENMAFARAGRPLAPLAPLPSTTASAFQSSAFNNVLPWPAVSQAPSSIVKPALLRVTLRDNALDSMSDFTDVSTRETSYDGTPQPSHTTVGAQKPDIEARQSILSPPDHRRPKTKFHEGVDPNGFGVWNFRKDTPLNYETARQALPNEMRSPSLM